jgi:hypothetical protein
VNPGNIFTQLVIDYWYKAMLVICTALLILSLVAEIKVIGNLALMELATGGILLSIGEWINHPFQQKIVRNPYGCIIGNITSKNRQPTATGNLFDICGFILIALGAFEVYKVLHL